MADSTLSSSRVSVARSFPSTINGCYVLSSLRKTAKKPGERAEYVRTATHGIEQLAERNHLPIVDFQACVGLATILFAPSATEKIHDSQPLFLGGSMMLQEASAQSLLEIVR